MKKILIAIFLVSFAMIGYSQSENSKFTDAKTQIDSLVKAYNVTNIDIFYGTSGTLFGASDFYFRKNFLIVNDLPNDYLYYFNLDRFLDFYVVKSAKKNKMVFRFL
jgi:hypothetical protein